MHLLFDTSNLALLAVKSHERINTYKQTCTKDTPPDDTFLPDAADKPSS
jgi:hypothetical protein